MPELPDPSLLLKNQRHELYAVQRSKGIDQGKAWKNTIPFGQAYTGGANSLRVSGHRVEKRPEVQSRMKWLIAQARSDADDVQEKFERSDIVKLFIEMSDILQSAYEAAVLANVAPQRLETLRSVYASHLGRQGRLTDDGDDALPDDEATSQITMMWSWMDNLGACACRAL